MKCTQRLIGLATLVLLFVLFYPNAVSGYPIADGLRFPLENYNIGNNCFGAYGLVEEGKWHLGEDANAPAGTPVYAVGNGKIMHAQSHTGYGGMYIIEMTMSEGEKVCWLSAHMYIDSFTKEQGQEVAKGEYLGKIGSYSQNGGWPKEHIHQGFRKGAFPSDWSRYIYGDWIFSGYTANKTVLNDWYDPSTFITSHQSTTNLVGKYSDSSLSQPILTRYTQSTLVGHPLGSPVSNRNGGVYVHNWNGVILQDFRGDSTGYYHGNTSIILNPAGTAAHLLKEGFWDCYMNNNGSIEFGSPFTEEITAKYANSPFVQTGDYVQPDNEIVVQKFQWVNSTERRTLVYNKTKGGDARRFPVGEFSIGSDRSENGVQWYVTKDSNPQNDIPWPKLGVLTPTGRWFTKAITGEQRYNFVRHNSNGSRMSGVGFTAAITEGNEQSAKPNGSPNPTPTSRGNYH